MIKQMNVQINMDTKYMIDLHWWLHHPCFTFTLSNSRSNNMEMGKDQRILSQETVSDYDRHEEAIISKFSEKSLQNRIKFTWMEYLFTQQLVK